MNKGIANLYQYRAAAQAANVRYLEALSVVNDPAPVLCPHYPLPREFWSLLLFTFLADSLLPVGPMRHAS